jgi:hypothetical protein
MGRRLTEASLQQKPKPANTNIIHQSAEIKAKIWDDCEIQAMNISPPTCG